MPTMEERDHMPKRLQELVNVYWQKSEEYYGIRPQGCRDQSQGNTKLDRETSSPWEPLPGCRVNSLAGTPGDGANPV